MTVKSLQPVIGISNDLAISNLGEGAPPSVVINNEYREWNLRDLSITWAQDPLKFLRIR